MIRTVVNIIKKHLDIGYSSYEEMWEAIELSPYNILLAYPDYQQLKRLARELISTIKDTNIVRLVKVPSQKETRDFLRSCMPTGRNGTIPMSEESLDWHARRMRLWLAGLEYVITEDSLTTRVRTS